MTETYTAETLKALEDNHVALVTFLSAILADLPIDKATAYQYLTKARHIRKEAGLK